MPDRYNKAIRLDRDCVRETISVPNPRTNLSVDTERDIKTTIGVIPNQTKTMGIIRILALAGHDNTPVRLEGDRISCRTQSGRGQGQDLATVSECFVERSVGLVPSESNIHRGQPKVDARAGRDDSTIRLDSNRIRCVLVVAEYGRSLTVDAERGVNSSVWHESRQSKAESRCAQSTVSTWFSARRARHHYAAVRLHGDRTCVILSGHERDHSDTVLPKGRIQYAPLAVLRRCRGSRLGGILN